MELYKRVGTLHNRLLSLSIIITVIVNETYKYEYVRINIHTYYIKHIKCNTDELWDHQDGIRYLAS